MAEVTRLPGRSTDSWDWQLDGACRRVSPETFFHPEGERGSRRRTRDETAKALHDEGERKLLYKAICEVCPVLDRCRAHALAVREPYGVWGGLSEDERERMYAANPPMTPGIAV